MELSIIDKERYKKLLIAHGCGLYNGMIYTNSLEAFNENYNNGFRRFEIDLHLTKEGDVISLHNILGYNFIPENDFGKCTIKYLLTSITDWPITVNNPIFIPKKEKVTKLYKDNQLTAITVADLAKICQKYPDVEFILDTKYTNYNLYMKQFNVIRKTFEESEMDLHQLTPQFYDIEMANNILREFAFTNNIYTLYMHPFDQKNVLREVQKNENIKGITISKARLLKNLLFIEKLHELGKECNVHTITNMEEIKEYVDLDIDGVYTSVKKLNLKI